MSGQQLKQIDRTLWELPRTGGMRVPGRIYATKRMLPDLTRDNAILKEVTRRNLL